MLEVPDRLTNAWIALGSDVQARVAAFLDSDGLALAGAKITADAPASFLDDLASGGGRLRAAFPRLTRRIVAIEPGARTCVRVACDGTHDGDFYGCLRASKRRVRFDAAHELVVRDGVLVAHTIAIDLRGIVRQLSAISASPSAA